MVSIGCLRNALACGACLALLGVAHAAPAIVSPAMDETVHGNTGSIRVVVQGVPAGMHLLPVLDGLPASEPVFDAVFHLRAVPRGTHELSVRLLDADGRTVMQTPPVSFHVWQASRLFRRVR
jgi:hypothetical protein